MTEQIKDERFVLFAVNQTQQTPESFAFTLQKVAELNPDRLSVFNYAHLPTLFAALSAGRR
jgi:coproporphyrinogen III oxidase-like Fe-S oxidoreductase